MLQGMIWGLLHAASLTTVPQEATLDAIEWCDSVEQARTRSAADGRPVLLYFTFDT